MLESCWRMVRKMLFQLQLEDDQLLRCRGIVGKYTSFSLQIHPVLAFHSLFLTFIARYLFVQTVVILTKENLTRHDESMTSQYNNLVKLNTE